VKLFREQRLGLVLPQAAVGLSWQQRGIQQQRGIKRMVNCRLVQRRRELFQTAAPQPRLSRLYRLRIGGGGRLRIGGGGRLRFGGGGRLRFVGGRRFR
jgi:hypothetical protein